MIMQIQNQQRKYKIDYFVPLVNKAIEFALANEKIGKFIEKNNIEAVFSVTFTNNQLIRKMNNEYRGIDKKTDVLSFPLLDFEGKIIEKVPKNELYISYNSNCKLIKNEVIDINKIKKPELNFGDIVLSLEKAHEQALEYGHSIEREITFLTVHSVLHLIGYDHLDQNDEKKMIRHQKQIMKNLF